MSSFVICHRRMSKLSKCLIQVKHSWKDDKQERNQQASIQNKTTQQQTNETKQTKNKTKKISQCIFFLIFHSDWTICTFKWFVELHFLGCSSDYTRGLHILLMRFHLSLNILPKAEYISKWTKPILNQTRKSMFENLSFLDL